MNGNPSSDKLGEELYLRFAEGDESAFAELVGLYRESLTMYIYSFVKDMYEAEDLMIDTFACLAEELGFEGRSSLKTYLFAIARHLAMRCLKKRRNRVHVSIEELVCEPGASGGSSPETDYLRGERRERLRNCMQKLKPEYSEVLNLLYFENMSYAGAAKTMKKTKKQIDNLTYNAKISLKAVMESEGFTYEEQ
ncbi:MAG: RNA polymerase sigma factor [Clostridiales bacterium]|nr:RNA polymerase sigma factor [Clostridiales bacterium]